MGSIKSFKLKMLLAKKQKTKTTGGRSPHFWAREDAAIFFHGFDQNGATIGTNRMHGLKNGYLKWTPVNPSSAVTDFTSRGILVRNDDVGRRIGRLLLGLELALP